MALWMPQRAVWRRPGFAGVVRGPRSGACASGRPRAFTEAAECHETIRGCRPPAKPPPASPTSCATSTTPWPSSSSPSRPVHREERWVELGYSSLFYFLTRELGLSKGAAYYRKIAAELVQVYPEVLAALREGKLCLSSIVELSKVLTPENRSEVLPRFFHVSKREAKEVTAELLPDPAPPLRTVVTVHQGGRLPGGDAPGHHVASDPASARDITDGAVHPANLVHANSKVPGVAPVASVPATGAASDAAEAAEAAEGPARARRADAVPLTAELTRLHVTVSRRLLEKLAAARDALSHSHPRASDDEILELGLDLIVDRHRKRRGIGAKPRKASDAARAAPHPSGAPSEAPPSASFPSPAPDLAVVALRPDPRSPPPVPAPPRTSPRHPPPAAPLRVTAPLHPPPAAPLPFTAPRQTRTTPPASPPPPGRSRHVPADVWRAVWARDRGRCVWPVDGGGVCGSTRKLQLDHVDGWALGAETTADSCRILCVVHNDLHARALYGDALMNRYSGAKGARGAEPNAGA
jgi:hypothetical protein